jgi:hypothetical protein
MSVIINTAPCQTAVNRVLGPPPFEGVSEPRDFLRGQFLVCLFHAQIARPFHGDQRSHEQNKSLPQAKAWPF